MTPRPRYFFVHLQKTAGTALFKRLRFAFGEARVYPLPTEQGTPEVVLGVDRMLARVHAPDADFAVVTGHFPLAAAARIGPDVRTFTVVRDPVERVLSFLRHQAEVEPRFAGWDLERIYEEPVSTGPLVADHMVRMLSMRPEEMTDGALSPVVLDDDRLRDACRNLTEHIDVMGLQEEFEVFCADLEAAFGWDLGPSVFMNRTAPAPASDALRRRIAADNRLDRQLYDHAVEHWRARHP